MHSSTNSQYGITFPAFYLIPTVICLDLHYCEVSRGERLLSGASNPSCLPRSVAPRKIIFCAESAGVVHVSRARLLCRPLLSHYSCGQSREGRVPHGLICRPKQARADLPSNQTPTKTKSPRRTCDRRVNITDPIPAQRRHF